MLAPASPRRFAAILLTLLAAAACLAAPAKAQTHKGVELVHADLLADTTAVTPGKPFTIGLRLKMAPHWHTYWVYSGEAGLPTKIEWQLPAGFTAGPFQWPVPEKLISPGDIINFGYNDEVVLLTEITPPAQLPAGEIVLKGKSDWLVCEALCVPGSADLSLKLPTDGTPAPANAEVFARYRARLPRPYDEKTAGFALTRQVSGTDIVLTATTPAVSDFFPLPVGDADAGHAKVEHLSAAETRVTIPVTTGAADVDKIGGLLVVGRPDDKTPPVGWMVAPGANLASAPMVAPELPPVAKSGDPLSAAGGSTAVKAQALTIGSLLSFLLLGFLGGTILNVMPCVLPVLSLKLFSLVKNNDQSSERTLRIGLAYAAGVFAWFLGFAALVIGFKAAGQQVGYAFHLQNPWFIFTLSVVTFVFALSLLGVYEIILPGSVTNAAGTAASGHEGLAGAFLQGMLATVLGSACLAPFLGAALGFAFSQNGPVIFAMFAAIAAGMSAPFVLIAANPRWLKFLPKPGEWMERVKQGTGFLMLATVLWLLWVLGRMRGSDAVVWTGVFLLVCGVACWVQGSFNTLVSSDRSRWLSRFVIAMLLLGGGWLTVGQVAQSRLPVAAGSFTAQLDAALKTGRPVFVDFTADWCFNCKANEKIVLNTEPIQQALRVRNAVFLKADWTSKSDEITKLIFGFGRVGIPLYVLYPAGQPDHAVVMPELLTKQIVLDAFTEADQRAKTLNKAVAAR